MEKITAAEILTLRPRTDGAPPAGGLPAALEFRGPHGMISYFLTAVPSEALRARAQALGVLESLKLYENEDGSWKLCLRGQDMDAAAQEYPMDAAEVAALLEKNGVGMPGRVQGGPAARKTAPPDVAGPETFPPDGDAPPPPEAELPPF